VGGAVDYWHGRLRDYLAAWTADQTGAPAPTEQCVPAWWRGVPYPMARLDFSAFVAQRRTHVDVGYATAATTDLVERQMRACADGLAAGRYVAVKRRRYPVAANPTEPLVPFIMEALGRPSLEAVAYLRTLAPADPAVRAVVLPEVWQAVSIITQTRLAELHISAEDSRPLK